MADLSNHQDAWRHGGQKNVCFMRISRPPACLRVSLGAPGCIESHALPGTSALGVPSPRYPVIFGGVSKAWLKARGVGRDLACRLRVAVHAGGKQADMLPEQRMGLSVRGTLRRLLVACHHHHHHCSCQKGSSCLLAPSGARARRLFVCVCVSQSQLVTKIPGMWSFISRVFCCWHWY